MQVVFYVFLFIIGACLGSFLCCQVRRFHYKEQKGTKTSKSLPARSICFSCKTKLKWYDNLPIISWLFLKGKCRNCGQKIGLSEFLSELGVALAFLFFGTTINIITATPLEWSIFIATLLLILSLSFLAIYDGTYGELPSLCLIISVLFALVVLVLKELTLLLTTPFAPDNILAPLLSVLILGGLYLILYLVSKGKWVGDGDWVLGTAIGIALFHPWYALITLFLANFLACIVAIPSQKKNHKKKIYFGPFMVAAFVITISFADFFISML